MTGTYGGNSMVDPLRRVLVCAPETAGWGEAVSEPAWRPLGFRTPPEYRQAREQHERLVALLVSAGCEVDYLHRSQGLTLDAVYTHDASIVTDRGAICLNMGKPGRAAEPAAHRRFYEAGNIQMLGEICSPATVESGDLVWLKDNVLLAGRGYRTNSAGVVQLQKLLGDALVRPVPLPHWDGPGACLHLMSLISLLDARTAVVDLALLAVETIELLVEMGYRLIEMDPSERATLACNVLALGNGRLIALAENPRTNHRIRAAGFEVLEFGGSEIAINGGGGPTCLTRPLLRRP